MYAAETRWGDPVAKGVARLSPGPLTWDHPGAVLGLRTMARNRKKQVVGNPSLEDRNTADHCASNDSLITRCPVSLFRQVE